MAEIPYWRFPHILIYACQMGDEQWADLLGLSVEDTVAWLEGDKERARSANDRLHILTDIITSLGQMRDARGIAAWLLAEHPDLDGVRPLDYISVGHARGPVVLAARQTAAREYGLTPDSWFWPNQ